MQDKAEGFSIDMPDWTIPALHDLSTNMPNLEERMAAVIRFSRLNFEHKTGGPFAAGVFECESGRLVTIAVNCVVPFHCSSAHAEIMALSLAQQQLGTYDLGGPGLQDHQLVVNCRPCTMCYGALLWSGIRSLVIAADGPEMEEITGFDEGPLPPQWQHELEKRGIEVVTDVLRSEAIGVFHDFASSQPQIYNSRLGN